eukprot:TRINITY_DN73479_c0_g1_i1.p1 TRINITY_DN73479_c0_g1~~TRINITY_DN73479_c0_g1_i1.p1  ORF type:complete len:201 (+),score=13.70 TRINITY_DN73479_c0_g1_i1:32-604(+)
MEGGKGRRLGSLHHQQRCEFAEPMNSVGSASKGDNNNVQQDESCRVSPDPEMVPIPLFLCIQDVGEHDGTHPQNVSRLRDAVSSEGSSLLDARLETRGDRAVLEASISHSFGCVQARRPVPSLGSVWHAEGRCLPCKYFLQNSGCKDGMSCAFCHLEHRGLSQGQAQKYFREHVGEYKRRFESICMRLSV